MKMELPELSLATKDVVATKTMNRSISESGSSLSKKRKLLEDQLFFDTEHLRSPLPLDWEQCLDLQSGEMYYLNKKTLRKSWNSPMSQTLDLELNMSSMSDSSVSCSGSNTSAGKYSNKNPRAYSNTNNTVALACSNCHLLVMISKSSPSCPNCKYVHSLPV